MRVGLHSIHATGMPRCAHTLAQIHDLDLRAIFAKYHLFAEERKILRAGGKNRHVLLPAAVLPSQTPLSLSSLFVEAAAPMFLERVFDAEEVKKMKLTNGDALPTDKSDTATKSQ